VPGSAAYEQMLAILRQYVSGILAESTLAQALAASGCNTASFGPGHAETVIEHAMIGLRMFCEPGRLPDLMIALAEYCAAVHPRATPSI
jgi:hypothetical protein